MVSRHRASTIAAPNMQATMVAGRGAITMPWVASVVKSVMSRMDDAISQEPGRELHKCRRSRDT